jgi:uncharacterized NAD-dependent epimerase/dehydratase family protein
VHGKLAHGLLRFKAGSVVGVLDPTLAGDSTDEIVPDAAADPVVPLHEALALEPTALVLGATPAGGAISESWPAVILDAIANGLDVVAGTHVLLANDPERSEEAARRGVRLVDLRRPPDDLIAMVGWASRSTARSATSCRRVAEALVLRAAENASYVVVEGHGSIAHPAFLPVTLASLHGAAPTDLVLCHNPARARMIEYERKPVPPLRELVSTYEELTRYVRPSRVGAVAVNTSGLDAHDAAQALDAVERELEVPAVNPVRLGARPRAAALVDGPPAAVSPTHKEEA